jgi:hypothetical protein
MTSAHSGGKSALSTIAQNQCVDPGDSALTHDSRFRSVGFGRVRRRHDQGLIQ